MLETGIKGFACVNVTPANTALAMGSGTLAVFATPALAALVEQACWQSVAPHLEQGCCTVGSRLVLAHSAPSPLGAVVRCECTLVSLEKRKLFFTARMWDDAGEIGTAEHERFIVQGDRFREKAAARKA